MGLAGSDHQRTGRRCEVVGYQSLRYDSTRHALMVGLRSQPVSCGDAEALDFKEETFDRIFVGCLHHSPGNTPKVIFRGFPCSTRRACTNYDLIMAEYDWFDALGFVTLLLVL